MRRTPAVASVCLLALAAIGISASMRSSATQAAGRPVAHESAPARRAAASAPGRVSLTAAQVQQALASGILDRPIRSLLTVPGPLQFGQYVWNDAAVPAGPTWIRVDLHSQLISVFRSGHEIGTAVIVYGGDNKETPTGKLHILGKARDHRSSIYDASMPFTLRLTNDGVSIHGSSVRSGSATHGCIGVPVGFARHLFDAARIGDEVIIVPARGARA